MSSSTVVGRLAAKQVLATAYSSAEASLVSVVGRRRIGKTFLVKQVYADVLRFQVTGIAGASKVDQLANFALRIESAFGESPGSIRYSDWLQALADLTRRLDATAFGDGSRIGVFFDELPWLASRRSGFLQAFSWFWNSWAVDRDIVVVICGSAASWMVKKVVRDRGGLHNRITHRIRLEPFTLAEVRAFAEVRGLVDDPYQLVQLYMALGGVPFYLNQVLPGESAQQAIDRLLFAAAAPLEGEFANLYASLFESAEQHVAVVRALSSKQQGLRRNELAKLAGIGSSGTLARVLEELELSGFIMRSVPFGKKRNDALYRLVDEYTRFYFAFVEGHRQGTQRFTDLASRPRYRAWAGYAFENVALRHEQQLRAALGISGIHAVTSSYIANANEVADGVQIDLLFDRADRTVTLIEVKFTEEPFVLTKSYAAALRAKRSRFRQHTGTRKHVQVVLLTTFGLSSTAHVAGVVDVVLEIEALMRS